MFMLPRIPSIRPRPWWFILFCALGLLPAVPLQAQPHPAWEAGGFRPGLEATIS